MKPDLLNCEHSPTQKPVEVRNESSQEAVDTLKCVTSIIRTLVHAPNNTPNCIYTHTNNQQALK